MVFKKKINLFIPIFIFLTVIAGFIMYAFIKTAQRKFLIEQELLVQQVNIRRLAEENAKIESEIEEFGKESFVEKEIRKNLNLKKASEEVVFIVGGSRGQGATALNSSSEYQKNKNDSIAVYRQNASDWFNYLFLDY